MIKTEPQFELNWFNETEQKKGLKAQAYRI